MKFFFFKKKLVNNIRVSLFHWLILPLTFGTIPRRYVVETERSAASIHRRNQISGCYRMNAVANVL